MRAQRNQTLVELVRLGAVVYFGADGSVFVIPGASRDDTGGGLARLARHRTPFVIGP